MFLKSALFSAVSISDSSVTWRGNGIMLTAQSGPPKRETTRFVRKLGRHEEGEEGEGHGKSIWTLWLKNVKKTVVLPTIHQPPPLLTQSFLICHPYHIARGAFNLFQLKKYFWNSNLPLFWKHDRLNSFRYFFPVSNIRDHTRKKRNTFTLKLIYK